MSFLPGKPNFGSSVGCSDTLLVHKVMEATTWAENGTKQAQKKANVKWRD